MPKIPLLLVALLSLNRALAIVDVVVEMKVFHVPGIGARAEVNMAVIAGTAVAVPNKAGFMQARVEALTILERNGEIKAFAKTEVLGPERLDSLQSDIVHQEFFDLEPGEYALTLELRDLNSADTTVTRYNAPLAVAAAPTDLQISDMLFAERIVAAEKGVPSKFGHQVVPLLADYLPQTITSLSFYAEVYNTDVRFGKDSLYLLVHQIESYESRKVFGAFKQTKRMTGKPAEPVFANYDITQLPSGNYLAVVEVRNKRDEVIARRELFFQRNNKMSFNYDLASMGSFDLSNTFAGALTDADSLAEHINSLLPIADQLETKIIDDRWRDRDPDLMRRFFYSFWANRSTDPEQAWRAYRSEVIKVNRMFGCRVLKGYETDRGRVYLKYGPPNSMMDRFNEMDALPYSLWHYYRAGRFADRRFVFYQPDLANACLRLLHSEVPGEIQNPRWNQVIHSRNVAMPNVDPQRVNSLSGERADEFFLTPR
jgi:GWxTD domain-containing protein